MGWVMASNICKWHTKSPILVKGNLTLFKPVISLKVTVVPLLYRKRIHLFKTLMKPLVSKSFDYQGHFFAIFKNFQCQSPEASAP